MANHLVCALVLEPGDHVLLEHPCYEPPLPRASVSLAPTSASSIVPPAEGFRIDPTRVEAALAERTKLLVLSNLHNPSGALSTSRELEAVAELARERGFYVLVDEVLPRVAL